VILIALNRMLWTSFKQNVQRCLETFGRIRLEGPQWTAYAWQQPSNTPPLRPSGVGDAWLLSFNLTNMYNSTTQLECRYCACESFGAVEATAPGVGWGEVGCVISIYGLSRINRLVKFCGYTFNGFCVDMQCEKFGFLACPAPCLRWSLPPKIIYWSW